MPASVELERKAFNRVFMKTFALLILLLSFFMMAKEELTFAEEELNCENALTTNDINRCMSLELNAAEEVMESYLQKSKEHYASDQVVIASIDEAQKAWLIYRQMHCGSVFNAWRDGTIRTSMSIDCLIKLTRQRTFDIWYSFLTYADSTPPLLPEPSRSKF